MKKLFSIMLVLIISLSMVTTVLATESEPSSWAKDAVTEQLDRGVGEFLQSRYQDNITRAEFARLAVEWLTAEVDGDIEGLLNIYMGQYLGSYSEGDVSVNFDSCIGIIQEGMSLGVFGSASWYYDDVSDFHVSCAAALKIVSGVGNNKFNPDGLITREQAAVMIMRAVNALERYRTEVLMLSAKYTNIDLIYCETCGYQLSTHSPEISLPGLCNSFKAPQSFADIDTVSTWALEGVNFVKANGIMNGTGNNNFSPKSNYTIEQAIMTFSNIK